jgi:hypothetical protein
MSATIQQTPAQTAAIAAILVRDSDLATEDRNLARIAEFLGIPVQLVPLDAVDRELARSPGASGYHALCSASTLAAALVGCIPGTLPLFLARAESIYVYAFDAGTTSTALLRSLTGCPEAGVADMQGSVQPLQVSGDHKTITGALTNVTIRAESTGCPRLLNIPTNNKAANKVISGNDGDLLRLVDFNAVRFYLSAAHEVIDIDAGVASKVDVRKHAATVPLIMYLAWAFQQVRWLPSETGACLIIDDPPLWPRYGFVNLAALSRSVQEHQFAATMAFIPWNWNRTKRDAIATFRENPDRMSICMHGCDHTDGEFASRNVQVLNKRIKIAKRRMDSLTHQTGLAFDPVMVFPQGNFSMEAGRVLKLNGLTAAVNTEVAPRDGSGNTPSIAQTWDMAISTYGAFPLFTRRYISDGIENFAFDSFIGKPCLIASHHGDFRDRGRAMLDFVSSLNGLHTKLTWRPIGELVRHSYKVRTIARNKIAIQMFGTELHIQNKFSEPALGAVYKTENDAEGVTAVVVDNELAPYQSDSVGIHITAEFSPAKNRTIKITYSDVLPVDSAPDSARYRLKVATRRALSEFRDNYVSRSELLSAFASLARRIVKRIS